MSIWIYVTAALVTWNLLYCCIRIVADFRRPPPRNAIGGIVAALGSISTLALFAAAYYVASSHY